MSALLDVILPVFLVIGFGYLAVWKGFFSDSGVDGLMKFTQNFAIPCLLFQSIATLDLQAGFPAPLLASFYLGAASGFVAGLLGGRLIFGRSWADSVAIGFCGLFSNSVLLGLPITERAFGDGTLQYNYAIIAMHAPFCYLVGVTAMELVRSGDEPLKSLPIKVLRAMFRNALVIGIALGLAVNLTGLPLPGIVADALDLIVRAALPAALFGLGGVLVRYRPEGDMRVILWVCGVSLILHPTVAFGLGTAMKLSVEQLRAAVLTGAMAPGVNSYIFANMYGAARRVAASAVLIATVLSIGTVWIWLLILP
ncbi:malonate transporter, putative [Oceaniovalibus guishaninsula JLT2003]|uniref:Malonate transporter, putative n=1 Tax=Oceaniovalibus guishaninsula JLT2003 TaxID=1231392 RepID=K2HRL7_9RHOB|nr:AEC family transporter [Oceaniovalibus guishaninsula]EKE45404.1 malonate transporter, putative [Oceaniovalibus guishaninsula JLT2003]